MLAGVALPLDRLSAVQLMRHGLTRRVNERLGVLEVQFLSRAAYRLLPVMLDGELLILRWRNSRGESASLPCSLWTQLAGGLTQLPSRSLTPSFPDSVSERGRRRRGKPRPVFSAASSSVARTGRQAGKITDRHRQENGIRIGVALPHESNNTH